MKISILKGTAHIGLLLDLINKKDLEIWSYQMIEKDKSDDFYLDLLTCKNDNEVLETLGEIPDDFDSTIFFIRYFFSFFSNSITDQLWELIEKKIIIMYRVLDFSQVDDAVKLFLLRLKDDYELRQEGFGGSMDMPLDLINFLNQFPDFSRYQSELDRIGFPKLNLIG